jgi:hypothetical protein
MGSYMMENNPNVPNHQPAKNLLVVWLQSIQSSETKIGFFST